MTDVDVYNDVADLIESIQSTLEDSNMLAALHDLRDGLAADYEKAFYSTEDSDYNDMARLSRKIAIANRLLKLMPTKAA